MRILRTGSVARVDSPPAFLDEFLPHCRPDDQTGCWIWTGRNLISGYPVFTINRSPRLAHRVSYLWFVGDIPDGAEVAHACDTPLCVNPSHLFLATHAENMRDMANKGRSARGPRLTPAAVREIRAAYRTEGWRSVPALAARFGVTPTSIRNAALRITWATVPDTPP